MSLLLTIDVGNTNTVLGVHDGAVLKSHWRLTTRREQTTDEYGILVRNLALAMEFLYDHPLHLHQHCCHRYQSSPTEPAPLE